MFFLPPPIIFCLLGLSLFKVDSSKLFTFSIKCNASTNNLLSLKESELCHYVLFYPLTEQIKGSKKKKKKSPSSNLKLLISLNLYWGCLNIYMCPTPISFCFKFDFIGNAHLTGGRTYPIGVQIYHIARHTNLIEVLIFIIRKQIYLNKEMYF